MPALAAAAPVDVATYRATLQQASARLRDDPGSTRDVARTLNELKDLQLPDGSVMHPDLSAVVADLNGPSPDPARDADRLTAMLGVVDRGSSAPDDSVDRLEEVLGRREFRDQAEEITPSPIDRLNQWIDETIVSPALNAIADGYQRLGIVVPLVGLALLAGAGYWIARSLRRTVGAGGVSVAGGRPRQTVSSAEMRAEAERLARAGAYRPAIRMLYLAVLTRLDERGLLGFDRARTDQEVLLEAAQRSEGRVGELLAPLVERFERYWYGDSPCSDQDYTEFSQLAQLAWEMA